MNLTDCVLVLISLVGLAKLIQSVLPLKFCISFVYAQLIIAFLLFTAGLIGELKPIAISLRVIGWLSFCIWIVPKINTKNTGQVQSYANLYLLVTISLLLLFTYSTYYQTYAGVDDYAHWAPISRSLALNDHLVTKELAIHGHADYPPRRMLVKASGVQLSDIELGRGYVEVDYLKILQIVDSADEWHGVDKGTFFKY